MQSMSLPPTDFSGLLYPPDAEVGVYLLMGLLWEYLPQRIVMESFELDPKREGHTHSKYLDAKAKVLADDGWKDVTLEFKLNSSGLLRDLEKHPGLAVDLIVCWTHDAPAVEPYVGDVLELKSVFWALAKEKRERIIWDPDHVVARGNTPTSTDEILNRFSEANRTKVKKLLALWPQVSPGASELRFMLGAVAAFRACAYSSEHLNVALLPAGVSRASLAERFQGKELQTSVRIPLEVLGEKEMSNLVALLKSARKGHP